MQREFHVMAAAETGKLPPISDVRTAITEVSNAAKAIGEILQDGPLKTKCLEIHTGMTTTLAGLPKDDAPVETIKAEPIIANLLSTLHSAQVVMVQVQAGMTNELCALVEREVSKRVAAGSLMTPEDHTSKVEAAKHECHQGMMEHMKRYGSRINTLASAKMPVPDEATLLLPDDQYKPRFDTAALRLKKLEPFAGALGNDRLQALAWKTDDASFNVVADSLSTVTPKPVEEKKVVPPNPFENSNPRPGAVSADRARLVGAVM